MVDKRAGLGAHFSLLQRRQGAYAEPPSAQIDPGRFDSLKRRALPRGAWTTVRSAGYAAIGFGMAMLLIGPATSAADA
jgi:hypothetical protein